MKPETAKKLMSDVPEMREFISYIGNTAIKLIDLTEMRDVPPADKALEATARLRAYDALMEILKPLIGVDTRDKKESTAQDFVV